MSSGVFYFVGIILEFELVDRKHKNDDEDNKYYVNYHYIMIQFTILRVRISISFGCFDLGITDEHK